MKLTHKNFDRSDAWLLLGYALCLLTTFTSQHHIARQIVTGIAASVLLLVALAVVRSRWRGCAGTA